MRTRLDTRRGFTHVKVGPVAQGPAPRDWRVGLGLAVAAAALFGLVSGWWTPRGPITTSQALATIGGSLLVGDFAGGRSATNPLVDTLTANGPPPYADVRKYEPALLTYENQVYPYDHRANAESAGGYSTNIFVKEYSLMEQLHGFAGFIDTFAVLYPQLQNIDFRSQQEADRLRHLRSPAAVRATGPVQRGHDRHRARADTNS